MSTGWKGNSSASVEVNVQQSQLFRDEDIRLHSGWCSLIDWCVASTADDVAIVLGDEISEQICN